MDRKFLSAALALSLAAALALPVSAAGNMLLIAPNPNAVSEHYTAEVVVNGETVDQVTVVSYDPKTWDEIVETTPIGDLPGAPRGYVPMRLLCGADPKGYSEWIKEEDSAVFALNGNGFYVDFSDLSVVVAGEKVEGVTAYLSKGVTFLPVDFLNTLEHVSAELLEIDGDICYDVTLAADPVMALVQALAQNGEMFGQEVSADDLEAMGFGPELCTAGGAQLPMMTSPDTVMVLQVAQGQEEEVKALLQEYVDTKKETFSWYLTQHYPKVEDARIEEYGGWMLLYIGENADQAVTLFRDGVVDLNAALSSGKQPR